MVVLARSSRGPDVPPPNGKATGRRDREPTQSKRLNCLTRLSQTAVQSSHRSILVGLFSVEPERKAKAIALARSTLIHLDLKQGALSLIHI